MSVCLFKLYFYVLYFYILLLKSTANLEYNETPPVSHSENEDSQNDSFQMSKKHLHISTKWIDFFYVSKEYCKFLMINGVNKQFI